MSVEASLDRWLIFCIEGTKVLINIVHGRDYFRKISGLSRKEKCRLLKNLE
jgi:hypothetical protein